MPLNCVFADSSCIVCGYCHGVHVVNHLDRRCSTLIMGGEEIIGWGETSHWDKVGFDNL